MTQTYETELDDLDHARVRIAAEDHAATYYGGVFNFGPSDAARYTSEGHLGALCDRYDLGPVWRAVAAELEARPGLLTDTAETRHDRAAQRADQCEQAASRAFTAYKNGRRDEALAEITAGELLDPDHLVAGRHGWARLREVVTRAE